MRVVLMLADLILLTDGTWATLQHVHVSIRRHTPMVFSSGRTARRTARSFRGHVVEVLNV